MSIFQRLNQEQKLTIIQVTHDETIGRHANRLIRLLDGKIESEETVDNPLKAQADLIQNPA